MAADIRTVGYETATAGVSRRVRPEVSTRFPASVWAAKDDALGEVLSQRVNEVEVQAFIPMDERFPIVSIGLHIAPSETTPSGLADMSLTPDEAMAVAKALILAVAEAEDIQKRTYGSAIYG